MSEFQYYEFQSIDRLLNNSEMAALREYSTRARITPARFVSHYSYGDFKGDVEQWMERYFDAFLYMANGGTRRLILRFPSRIIDTKLVKQYCQGNCARCWATGIYTIVEFVVEECAGGDWLEEDNDFLARLLPARMEVSLNDYRVFYLGWLLSAQYGGVSAKTFEPPVPRGLGALSPALNTFVEFFSLDPGLLRSAASNSGELRDINADDIEPCVAGLSSREKYRWLLRLALEDNPNLHAEFRRVILPNCGIEFFSDKPRRTVSAIVSSASRLDEPRT